MAVMTGHTSQVTIEEFERIAKIAAKESEAVRLEFIGGRIEDKGVPDGDHNEIYMWLQSVCMQYRPELGLYPSDQGLAIERYRTGRARPDASLAPRGSFAGQGEWADPGNVLMVVEVTSYDADTNRRDRVEKPAGYAGASIPLYLLIDRDACTLVVHARPNHEEGRYRETCVTGFGEVLQLPDPVGIRVDTGILKNYVR